MSFGIDTNPFGRTDQVDLEKFYLEKISILKELIDKYETEVRWLVVEKQSLEKKVKEQEKQILELQRENMKL